MLPSLSILNKGHIYLFTLPRPRTLCVGKKNANVWLAYTDIGKCLKGINHYKFALYNFPMQKYGKHYRGHISNSEV